MRWSYQSTASSSSMIETMARCRSMVSGFRDCSLSCKDSLLAIEIEPLRLRYPSNQYA